MHFPISPISAMILTSLALVSSTSACHPATARLVRSVAPQSCPPPTKISDCAGTIEVCDPSSRPQYNLNGVTDQDGIAKREVEFVA